MTQAIKVPFVPSSQTLDINQYRISMASCFSYIHKRNSKSYITSIPTYIFAFIHFRSPPTTRHRL
ncbi:Protein of unknown function [Pyronema omphalodes CBS 100304]|uniref:Uncharacterized protein n=1 Tax=Pyronema omphalodes (strain CBS 100304) TaxID=1076935 RepID=U4LPU6_PYROM|nr:Protein of unknown function [Pyronema omphalodes CBS 100304]